MLIRTPQTKLLYWLYSNERYKTIYFRIPKYQGYYLKRRKDRHRFRSPRLFKWKTYNSQSQCICLINRTELDAMKLQAIILTICVVIASTFVVVDGAPAPQFAAFAGNPFYSGYSAYTPYAYSSAGYYSPYSALGYTNLGELKKK